VNDRKLQQDGTIQYATRENHNWFGANFSRAEGIIVLANIKLEKQTQVLHALIQD
jgi:hypothetical protein